MAKTKKKSAGAREGESSVERALRKETARLQLDQVRAQRAMLATYGAADRGRINRDWRASPASADAAIIPDAAVLNARGRQCVRDSWIGRSAVRAFSRNVVGCGILPVPMVKDKKGKFLPKINKRLLKLFWYWANNKEFCDVERRQSYWQKQNLLVEERVTVGESFLVWSYRKNDDAGAVGLRVQSFEPEQLDNRLQSWTDVATGESRQVRGGIEVDEYGAAVAYHFFTRNPADYLPLGYNSVRIPAARVTHYFKQERVLQSRGVTQLAPVLQDARDFNRFKQATLWRAIMEACIGGVVTREGAGSGSVLNFNTQTSADPNTPGGKRQVDFTPGMVVDLAPGETFNPFMPTTPGSQYVPFTDSTINGFGAGIGLSGSQITRKSDSNYSAARQDMLEDRREFEPEQEMLAHNTLLNWTWPLFVRLAYMEGKLDDVLDGDDFLEDTARYCEAEYVAPAAPWIDPEKEANAYEKLVKLKVIDRDEIAHLRGRRLDDIWDKIEAEQELAEKKGILLPEVIELETMQQKASQPAPVPFGGKEPPEPAKKDDKAQLAQRLAQAPAAYPPPHYRDATTVMNCGTCSFLVGAKCSKFNVVVEESKVCDAWDAAPVKRSDDSGRKILQVPTPAGQAPLDSNFQSPAARTSAGPVILESPDEKLAILQSVPKFGCLMAEFSGDMLSKLRHFGESKIKKLDLFKAEADGGIETNPHITVRYGFHAGTVGNVQAAIAEQPPILGKLGKVKCFKGRDNGKDYDVVYVEVESIDLKRTHGVLGAVANTNTHREYVPHLTLAYVTKGRGSTYEDDATLEGQSFEFSSLIFSDENRNQTVIQLAGPAKAAQ